LALDPESGAAADLVTSLLVEPPEQLPAELVADLDREARRATAERTRFGTYGYIAIFLFWCVVPFLHVRNWSCLISFNAVLMPLILFGWLAARRGRISIPIAMLANLVLAITMTRISGPFLLTPLLICGALLAFAADPW